MSNHSVCQLRLAFILVVVGVLVSQGSAARKFIQKLNGGEDTLGVSSAVHRQPISVEEVKEEVGITSPRSYGK